MLKYIYDMCSTDKLVFFSDDGSTRHHFAVAYKGGLKLLPDAVHLPPCLPATCAASRTAVAMTTVIEAHGVVRTSSPAPDCDLGAGLLRH